MSIVSGKVGVVNGVSTVRQWAINQMTGNKPFYASNTGGAPGRMKGNRDWHGSFQQFAAQGLYLPCANFTFAGSTGGGKSYSGSAIMDSVKIDWDWENAEIITIASEFSGNGALTRGTSTYTDSSPPSTYETIGTAIAVCTPGGSPADIPNVLRATLTFTAQNQQYVNSSTAGLVLRKAGNIDWELSVQVQTDDMNDLPALGALVEVQAFVNLEDFFQLNYGMVEEYSNLVVNVETGEIESVQLNIKMAAFDADGDRGAILLPDTTQYWPFS